MFEVKLSAEAERFCKRADPALMKKLARCFQQLEANPRRHNNIKSLRGKLAGSCRFRPGDRRVAYTIDDAKKVVAVSTIGPRQNLYE